jgi:hypothetical protein
MKSKLKRKRPPTETAFRVMFQFPLGHLRYAMIHKTGIVPSGTNENSDHHGDRPARRKIRHDGTIVTATSTT